MEKGVVDVWPVFCYSPSSGTAVTGATITSLLFNDGVTSGTATTDTNPTELGSGWYQHNITSSENDITSQQILIPTTTSGAQCVAYPNPRFPRPENFNYLGVSTSGNANTDVKLIEGADPSDTIRDSIVDDATRIDASELNTLSGHDPGATLGTSTLTTAQTQATATAALNAYDPPTRTELTSDTDSILAGITAGTGTVQADIATAQSDLDILTGADGVTLATLQGNYAPNVVVPDSAGTAPTAAEIKTAMEADGSHLALIKAVTDALTTAAATNLALSAGVIVPGTVSHDNTASSTTVFYSDDITESTADHYNGRIVIFTSGALKYQATDITDYALDTGEGKFTVTALTEAPSDNVTFIIV